MAKTKVKVTIKTGRKGDAGTLVARIPVTVVKTDRPTGQLLYKTRAQLNVHLTTRDGKPRAKYRSN